MRFVRTDKIIPNKEHYLWYKNNEYVAFGNFKEGQLAVKVSDRENDGDLLSVSIYNREIPTVELLGKFDGNEIFERLGEYFGDDKELIQALNGQHPDYVIELKGRGGWQLDYIDEEGCVCVQDSIGLDTLSECLDAIENMTEKDLSMMVDRCLKFR